MQQVKFTRMKDGTRADYDLLAELERPYIDATAERLLSALQDLDHGLSGYKISRLGHSLQTATRARRDGADTDWIVTALLHDIGDGLAPFSHDKMAAAILQPFVREQCTWVCAVHGDFQLVYYGRHIGADPEKRARYHGHRYYQDCVDFCERWDQASFDPDYATDPLEAFAPLVHEVFARKPYDPAHLRDGERVSLFK